MSETAISIEHINKVYKLYDKPIDRLKESLGLSKTKLSRDHYALRDVSFRVNKGETVGIIGTNGAGKSTILKIITGVLNPTSGDLKINGRISALLELGAGFNMEYTGIENIYLNGTMIGFSKEEIDQKLEDILKFADIGDFVYQPVKTYSSGMFVRLAFAVAINIDPEILIVDEALSVGDVFFQAKCYKKFEEFKSQGRTILFVSHDLNSIGKYCDRVVLLNKGEKLAEGSAKEMVDLYKKLLVHHTTDEHGRIDAEEETVNLEGIVWKDRMNRNPNVLEYGTKEAEIIDYCIIDKDGYINTALGKGDSFKIRIKIRFHTKLEDPIVAFTIKDLKGTEISGTNTMYENTDIGEIQDGKCLVIEFEQENNLLPGEYLLSLGCTGFRNGEFAVYHRLYDVCNFSVISQKPGVGFFDMNSTVMVRWV